MTMTETPTRAEQDQKAFERFIKSLDTEQLMAFMLFLVADNIGHLNAEDAVAKKLLPYLKEERLTGALVFHLAEHSDARARRLAISLLPRLPQPSAVAYDVWMILLRDRDYEIRGDAARSIGRVYDALVQNREAIPVYLQALLETTEYFDARIGQLARSAQYHGGPGGIPSYESLRHSIPALPEGYVPAIADRYPFMPDDLAA